LRATSPTELRQALRTAFKVDVPAVIEIPSGPMPDPWPLLRQPPHAGVRADSQTDWKSNETRSGRAPTRRRGIASIRLNKMV